MSHRLKTIDRHKGFGRLTEEQKQFVIAEFAKNKLHAERRLAQIDEVLTATVSPINRGWLGWDEHFQDEHTGCWVMYVDYLVSKGTPQIIYDRLYQELGYQFIAWHTARLVVLRVERNQEAGKERLTIRSFASKVEVEV